jgi:hypothetical protein
MHEFPICAAERGNAIQNSTPKIKIIPLVNDPVIVTKSKFSASKQRGAWKFLEHHQHFPFQKDLTVIHDTREDIHIDLLATRGKPVAHRGELGDPLDPLDAVLEDDILVIVGEKMRPIRFSFPVVGPGPEFTKLFGCEWFHIFLVDTYKYNFL